MVVRKSQVITRALSIVPTALLLIVLCWLMASMYTATSLETASNDAFWHIKMGERFVEQPFFSDENFSFTYQGKEIKHYPFIFEVGLYYLDEIFSYATVSQIFLYATYLLGIALSLIYVWRTNNRIAFYLLVVAGFSYFYSQRLLVRPDLLYFPLIAIGLLLYNQAAARFTLKNYLGILALSVLWATYHTPIFLYVLLAGLYLDLAIKYIKDKKTGKDWTLLFLSGAAILLVEFLPPFQNHSLLGQFNFESRWKEHIVEYWNIFFRYSDPIDLFPLIIIATLSVGMAVKTKSYGYLLIILVFIIQSISMARIVPFAGYITVLLIIDMARQLESANVLNYRTTNVIAIAVSAILLLLYSYKGISPNNVPTRTEKPIGLINHYKNQNYSGNILNDYNVGGYLIYHLYPKSKVYIDGRTHILYDYPFFDHHRKILSSEKYLTGEDDKYNIDFLIIDTNTDFFLTAYHTGRYELDFLDKDFALFKKGNASLRKIGLVAAAPYCWNSTIEKDIQRELSGRNLPGLNKNLVEFIDIISAYGIAENKAHFLNSITDQPKGDFAKRFLGYQYFSHRNYQKSMEYFLAQKELKIRDYLVLALSAYENSNFDIANQAVRFVITNSNMRFDDIDVLLLFSIIDKLNTQIMLSPDTIEFFNIIKSDLGNRDLFNYSTGNQIELLCHPDLSLTRKVINGDINK